jgi:hypothetical protein
MEGTTHLEHLFTVEYERSGYRNLLPTYQTDLAAAERFAMRWLTKMGGDFKYVGIAARPHGMVIRNTRLPGVIERD